jgi:hypothetical protein
MLFSGSVPHRCVSFAFDFSGCVHSLSNSQTTLFRILAVRLHRGSFVFDLFAFVLQRFGLFEILSFAIDGFSCLRSPSMTLALLRYPSASQTSLLLHSVSADPFAALSDATTWACLPCFDLSGFNSFSYGWFRIVAFRPR